MSSATTLTETDVLVIGAGIYGCGTAYYLARFGLDVVVVDGGDIGAGASGANAGNLHLQLSPFSHAGKSADWISEFARSLPFFAAAVALWKRLAGELDADIELRCPGGIMVAETEMQMDALLAKVAMERAHGLAVEMLDAAQLRSFAPYIAPHLLGGAYCAEEGMANALLAVLALADGARRAGARFLLDTSVTNLRAESGGWQVDTPRGRIRCKRVVVAAGSSSAAVAALAGVDVPLSHRDIQMIATESCEPFIEHLLYHAESRLTMKQVANGNVLIGGGWAASRDPVFGRPAVLCESVRGSLDVAMSIVPRLGRVSVIRSWAGPNIYTPDGRPILGAVAGTPNLFLAICNTYGFTLGPLCALLVAELIAGQPSSFDLSTFNLSRFA